VRRSIQKWIKLKHFSVLTLVLFIILAFARLVKQNFNLDSTFNIKFKNSGSLNVDSNVGSMLNIEPKNSRNFGSELNSEPTLKTLGPTQEEKCSNKQTCTAKVTNIVDGDTIDISTGEKVRYVGVDTPETKHPKKMLQCFGKEASEKNKELVLDKEIRLEKDVSDKDRYGRLLRYVYLPFSPTDGNSDLFVNDYLARQGFAHAATFPPDVKFSEQFLEAEREARDNQRGLWAPEVCPDQ